MDHDSIQHRIAMSQVMAPPLKPVSDETLRKIIEEIDTAQTLLAQGLLREKEFNGIRSVKLPLSATPCLAPLL